MGYIDANEFAKSLGWKRAENILRLDREGNENKKPGIDILSDIIKAHPNFDFSFFLTGNKTKIDNTIVDAASEPKITTYSCTDCIHKQKEIDALKAALEAKEELLEMYRDKKNNRAS